MRIYVAGAWGWRDRAREVMYALVATGHTITYDWTQQAQFSPEQADKDVQGVMDAEALVMIMELAYPPYKGTWVEFGMAIARSIPIYILGTANRDTCIFMQLSSLHYITSLDEIPSPIAMKEQEEQQWIRAAERHLETCYAGTNHGQTIPLVVPIQVMVK